MKQEKFDYMEQIFSYFAYHNKNLTNKQWYMIEDLRLLVNEMKTEMEKNNE